MAVKICGITSSGDALAAAAAGADMLGFNFYERSPRFLPPERAAEIIRQLRQSGSTIECVGIFVDADAAQMREVAGAVGLDLVQMHGNETPDLCHALRPLRTIKALRVHRGFDPATADHFSCDMILLDSWDANQRGGTGAAFDWTVAAEIRRRVKHLILAGGLNASNVGEAIRQVRPDAVDVCSAVESTPGVKDAKRVLAFIEAVREASGAEVLS
ncbi:MAG: phosphoribosylanthranilate isomerase [Chthoniobacterales bacterium]